MILVVDIISYPEMCAEHGAPRSASTPALSVSAFFIIFFSKYARANSTGHSYGDCRARATHESESHPGFD